ncbi:SWIM-type domain-containing protein [Aphis craccivora]|uniref:SWIM-type domain-containing protein n=1 Tax=Aphis craccivora TaxID=307492 RepID=A0A6G0Z497_APHCR|nr:SWIM-type domain-containing protein [Aphis craccivora]
MDRISLADIYTFCSATPNTRNMVEGENILIEINILAIRDKPHNITESLQLNENAGNSQKCKYIVSTLLHLNRNGISSLEPISQTDLKCSWSSQKTALN